ncbi:MAG: TerB family tellurite resistance protein, partial [Pseudanabaenaceae cyanobacterium]
MNYGLLLLSHVICADRQIHNTEIELLDRFIEKHQPCPATLKAMESIFSQDEGHPSLEKCAEALLDSQDRRKLREFWLEIMEIAYTDGYLAPTEKEVIDKIARLWQLSQAEINEGIQAAEKFYRESRDKALSGEHYSSSSTVSFGAKLVSLAEKAFSREAVRNIAEVAPFGEIISRLQKEVLLAGPEYDQAIQHCAHIALEDYQFIYSKLSYVNQVLE